MEKKQSKLCGIVVYKIHPDGCLNGIWINNDPEKKRNVMNECARKIGENRNKKCLIGTYTVVWIENDQEVISGTLEISKENDSYLFEWKGKNSEIIFKGIGLKTGEEHLAAAYWEVD